MHMTSAPARLPATVPTQSGPVAPTPGAVRCPCGAKSVQVNIRVHGTNHLVAAGACTDHLLISAIEEPLDLTHRIILVAGSGRFPTAQAQIITSAIVRQAHLIRSGMVLNADEEAFHGITVIHGAEPAADDDHLGADTIVDRWCRAIGYPVRPFPADWAGPCQRDCRHGPRHWSGNVCFGNRGGTTLCPAAGARRYRHMVGLLRPGVDLVLGFPLGYPLMHSADAHTCMELARDAGVQTVDAMEGLA